MLQILPRQLLRLRPETCTAGQLYVDCEEGWEEEESWGKEEGRGGGRNWRNVSPVAKQCACSPPMWGGGGDNMDTTNHPTIINHQIQQICIHI